MTLLNIIVFTNQTQFQLLHVMVAMKERVVHKKELARVEGGGMDIFWNANKVIYKFEAKNCLCLWNENYYLLVLNKVHHRYNGFMLVIKLIDNFHK